MAYSIRGSEIATTEWPLKEQTGIDTATTEDKENLLLVAKPILLTVAKSLLEND
jgi:hypothetical protein